MCLSRRSAWTGRRAACHRAAGARIDRRTYLELARCPDGSRLAYATLPSDRARIETHFAQLEDAVCRVHSSCSAVDDRDVDVAISTDSDAVADSSNVYLARRT